MVAGFGRGLKGRLIFSYVALTLGLFGPLAYFARTLGRSALDAELGRRLVSLGQAAAIQISPELLLQLGPGDEQSRTYGNLQRKLLELVARTDVSRIQILDTESRILVDTQPGIAIGTAAHELATDRTEIAAALGGAARQSVRFRGQDGLLYKRGYAPLWPLGNEKAKPVGVVAVLGSAAAFEALATLDHWLLVYGLLGLGAVGLVSTLLARHMTRPLAGLTDWAGRVGRGDLEAPAPADLGHDEISQLGRTLETMRLNLLERDQRMKVMLAGIAHEVRNPLGGMELFLGVLREDLAAAGEAQKLGHVRKIERELAHLNQVVHDFLAYARRPKPERLPLDLAALAKEVKEVLAADADAAKVRLIVEVNERRHGGPDQRDGQTVGPMVSGDRGELRRAIMNLLRNALQASPQGGTVTVRCRHIETSSRVVLDVTDEGKGIPAELHEKIFAPFFTTKEKGTGLGLAFVKDIAIQHGARLTVSSPPAAASGQGSPQTGATFTMDFPAWRPSSS